MGVERRLPWHVWVTGVVLLGFAGYCISMVVAVRSLRLRLEHNVGTLGSLQALQTAAADSPPRWDDVAEEASRLPKSTARVVEIAARVRAGTAPIDELISAVDASMREIRGDSGRVARDLWKQWQVLYFIVGGAVLLGVANLALLVIAHRRRRRAEQSETELTDRHATLARTATRLAEGDLRSPVTPREREYDGFEAALEDMRRNLVDKISALEERNREVEQLADDLRRQIKASSDQLEVAAVQELTAKDHLVRGAVFAEHYRVVAPLGSGAAGDVYEVVNERDGRTFALKLMRNVREPQDKARFAREARLLADLQHDNIIGIHHIGTSAAGSPFLILDLVRGDNLTKLQQRHGDAAWLVPVLAGVADALAAVHAHGIVHRDIKPGNIVVDDSVPPVVKLVDFGIARTTDSDDLPAADTAAEVSPAFATQVGRVIGTPMYMAPELADGALATPAADVFAFGVTAYTVLARQRPFRIPPIDLAHAGGSATPAPLVTRCDGLDERVSTIVSACLSFDPNARPTAAAIAAALRESTTAAAM